MHKEFHIIIISIFILYYSVLVISFGAEFLCAHIHGLTPKQQLICRTTPDALAVIGEGTKLGISECQHLFRFSRWNCTIPTSSENYGHVVVTGSREAAFLYGITSSGVTYSITKACGRGNISSCGCAPPTTMSTSGVLQSGNSVQTHETWRWGGCSADVDFAVKLARRFMDAREIDSDARSLMNLHNNKAGRKVVQSTLETECKCHGVSGSCTLKTCWVKLPSFREIGQRLLEKYQKARPVVAVQGVKQGPRSRRSLMLLVRPRQSFRHFNQKLRERRRSISIPGKTSPKPRRSELVYLEQSPNYCEPNSVLGSLGTKGRKCLKNTGFSNITFTNEESCDILCCGRGYNTHVINRKWKCHCKFKWCCEVNCRNCSEKIEIYICN